jgi:hypothetical protein
MPDKYDDFLFDDNETNKEPLDNDLDRFSLSSPYVPEDMKEPLDEVLDNTVLFQEKAESFSKLLSDARAVDHKVSSILSKLFFASKDKQAKNSMEKERAYHLALSSLFEQIISPMKELAQIHLTTVKQFNQDIGKNYYSIEKVDREIEVEKSKAVEGIYLQRLVLADAANDLQILEDALSAAEDRLKNYIDAGGINNISASEVAIISSKREILSTGETHKFDYSFFLLNAIDKIAITFGLYQKETSNQYIKSLAMIFDF